VGLSNKMSRQEIRELFHGMRDKMPELIQVMQQMPRELVLILRNFNLVFSYNVAFINKLGSIYQQRPWSSC
jgi:hypothetical protein